MPDDTISAQFQAEAAAEFERLKAAIEGRSWDDAIYAQIAWLFWRAAALSARLGVNQKLMLGATGRFERFVALKTSCLIKWQEMGPDAPGHFEARKIESVIDTLDALLNLTRSFLAVGAASAPAQLALAGGEIGRADIMMTLAETGQWDRVFDLEKRHKALYGGSIDRRPIWEEQFEPAAVKIADGKPVKRATMIREVRKWHAEYRDENGKSSPIPAEDTSIGKGIDRLAARKIITLIGRTRKK